MSAEIITSDADPQLRRNSLGLAELVFQGATHIAPATNIVFTFPIIALKAGPGYAAFVPALHHRLLFCREYRGPVLAVHAVERRFFDFSLDTVLEALYTLVDCRLYIAGSMSTSKGRIKQMATKKASKKPAKKAAKRAAKKK